MELLKERIIKDGTVRPGQILKVDSFLNHQMDIDLINEIGKEFYRRFEGQKISKIMTIEASGIAFAFAVAAQLGVPMAFAKKHSSANVGNDIYSAVVHSYTHNKDYTIVISKEYLSSDDKILIADDFLACGNALNGLMAMAKAAGAEVVGCAIAVEKGFQHGGDGLREDGYHVESLAIIEQADENGFVFR